MSALAEHVQNYLQVRRALGFKLVGEEQLLREFVTFADAAGQAHNHHRPRGEMGAAAVQRQPQLSLAAAARGPRASRATCRRWIPPARSHRSSCCPPANTAPTPYLYGDREILALMAAARRLRPPLRAATFETLIGLLACTGLRIGEAIRLDREDVDLEGQLLTVRNSKFGKSREVLLHPSTVGALTEYGERRDRLCPHAKDRSFFITTRGSRLVPPDDPPAVPSAAQAGRRRASVAIPARSDT